MKLLMLPFGPHRVYRLLLPVVLLFFYSCQKELDEAPVTCLVEKIDIKEGTATAASFSYTYDLQTAWPQTISLVVPGLGFNNVFPVSVSGKTITITGVGTIEFDGARRITALKIANAIPGIDAGEYFYAYGPDGFLDERLFDDGASVLERTKFAHDGKSLTSFLITYENNPVELEGQFTYSNTPQLTGSDAAYFYGDIFPELQPFLSFIKMGKTGIHPLQKIEVSAGVPAVPVIAIGFDNVTLNDARAIVGFASNFTVPGAPAVNRTISITYDCR